MSPSEHDVGEGGGRPRRAYRVLLIAAGVAALYVAAVGARLVRWGVLGWVPSSIARDRAPGRVPDGRKYLIFVMADHYEPGAGPEGASASAAWLDRFRAIADRHADSSGHRFRYTWFYPYDHRNDDVLVMLSRMAFDGYGEVELHWHHPRTDSARFPAMLAEAVAWFQRRGALVASGDRPRTQFGFVHGNWALDGSSPRCGVDRELEILARAGCFADFTFSTIGTPSQPRKLNALYYPTDAPAPKSYDDGDDARVGRPVADRLLIFEGPSAIVWPSAEIEYGALEDDTPPSPARVARWIDAGIHVAGRPEWVFVKVYTHGIQYGRTLLGGRLDALLGDLERTCRDRGIALHYMTAREAVNVVKAAEDGRSGDPEAFRDYRFPRPRNMTTRDLGDAVVVEAPRRKRAQP